MTRYRFGGVADYAISVGTDNAATLQPSTSVTCWNQPSGGTQYTDLTDVDGTTPLTSLVTNAQGAVPEFYGPDGVTALYLDANGGTGPRRRTLSTDLGTSLASLEDSVADTVPASTVTEAGDLIVATGPAAVARLAVGGPGQTLVADTAAASGVRWGHDRRVRDLPDPVVAEALSTDVPTVSTVQQSTSTIASAQPLIPPDTGPFLYLGAGDFQYGTVFPDTTVYLPTSRYPNTYDSGQSNWSLEFMTDSAELEVMFKYFNSAARYRLTVDGRKVTDLPQVTGGITAGSRHVMKLTFADARVRRLRFDFAYFPFGGVFLPPGANIWKPVRQGGRLAGFGDSITDGSNENEGAGIGTWLYRAGRLLGCTDVWDQSRGGTGYTVPGSWATLGDRVATDITPYAIDRLIVWAGVNDTATAQATIGTAADNLYADLLGSTPAGCDITVIGCFAYAEPAAQSQIDTDNTLKASAAAAGLPFVSPITGAVYDAAGVLVTTQGPWITAQNAAAYIGADGVHPNDDGHQYLAVRIVEALKALMPH